MCYFIYFLAPTGADLTALRPIAESHGFTVGPDCTDLFANPPGRAYRATHSICDCDTVLGTAFVRQAAEDHVRQLTGKLRKKGWSEAKIARWIESKQSAQQKREGPGADELRRWLEALPAMVQSLGTDWLGITYHMHGDGKPIEVEHTESISAEDLTQQQLLSLRDDRLLILTR